MTRTYIFSAVAAGLTATIFAGSAHADEYAPAMKDYLDSNISRWAQSPEIVAAIKAQNTSHADFDQTMIETLDTKWQAEVDEILTPTITPVLTHPAANFLRDQVASADGQITEVIVMDAHGLNVATSHITSDYWQGDEAKFAQTYGVGPDAYHFGDVEFDDSTGQYQGQISLTITDPATGQPIGAMTVAVNVASLL